MRLRVRWLSLARDVRQRYPDRMVRRGGVWGSVVTLVVACGHNTGGLSEPVDTDASLADAESFTCPSEAGETSCVAPGPSFSTDVMPIIDRRCNNCHAEGTDGGPWPLGQYADIFAWRNAIEDDLLRCTMPPADGGTSLPDAERAVLMAWIVCGADNN